MFQVEICGAESSELILIQHADEDAFYVPSLQKIYVNYTEIFTDKFIPLDEFYVNLCQLMMIN